MTTNPASDHDRSEGGRFERAIARQAFRAPPHEWRNEILAGALATSPAEEVPARPRFGGVAREAIGRWQVWRERLASGWVLAAAAWLLILALDRFASMPTGPGPRLAAPLSAAAVETIREQQREVIGQLAVVGEPEPPPRPPMDRPRASHPERDERPVAGGGRGWRSLATCSSVESRRQPSITGEFV